MRPMTAMAPPRSPHWRGWRAEPPFEESSLEPGWERTLADTARALARGELIDRWQGPISDQAFVERVRDAKFILLGERRRSACDHATRTL